jgi:hypothetical protein
MVRIIVLSVVLLMSVGTGQASAWGCDGHQAVAMIAERLLSPAAIQAIKAILAASPVDPAIKPYCTQLPVDPIADSATWADDYRALDATTAGWHFINFPLAAGNKTSDYKKYCRLGNCVIDAIVTQYRILTTSADAGLKGNALRFIVHFVGDLHQPLHTTTNGDRGGNCMPVTFFGEAPQEDERHTWRPNLHSIWDESMIRRLMNTNGLPDSRALADYIATKAPPHAVSAQTPTATRVGSWARDAGTLARKVTYGKLPVTPPIEPAAAELLSCDDNNHVGRRMAELHEQVADSYQQSSMPVIIKQISLAGERLAATLKSVVGD